MENNLETSYYMAYQLLEKDLGKLKEKHYSTVNQDIHRFIDYLEAQKDKGFSRRDLAVKMVEREVAISVSKNKVELNIDDEIDNKIKFISKCYSNGKIPLRNNFPIAKQRSLNNLSKIRSFITSSVSAYERDAIEAVFTVFSKQELEMFFPLDIKLHGFFSLAMLDDLTSYNYLDNRPFNFNLITFLQNCYFLLKDIDDQEDLRFVEEIVLNFMKNSKFDSQLLFNLLTKITKNKSKSNPFYLLFGKMFKLEEFCPLNYLTVTDLKILNIEECSYFEEYHENFNSEVREEIRKAFKDDISKRINQFSDKALRICTEDLSQKDKISSADYEHKLDSLIKKIQLLTAYADYSLNRE